nr:hypothetical protein [Tanacetum cinerariifolium]
MHEPEHTEYLVPSEDEAPIEDQPLPADASPTALSPGYMADSDPNEDSDEDPKEDHAKYPVDGGDGDDELSDDDDDDDDTDDEDEEPFEDEDDDEEEEEHLALADSSAVPVVDLVPSAADIETFETDESEPTPRSPQTQIPFSHTRLRKARKTVRLEPPIPASIEACIAEHAAAPILPLPISSPPLPLPSPLTTSPTDTGAPLGYKAVKIRMRALLSFASHRTDVPEAEMPPQKRAYFTIPAPGLEIGESSAAGVTRQPGPTLKANLRHDRTQLTTTLGRIKKIEARDPERQEEPAEAGSSLERDVDRSRNGDDNHDSGTGRRRQVSTARECTYTDFLKCQPMNFKALKESSV